MEIKAIHPNFQLPVRGSEQAAGYDIYMPEKGIVHVNKPMKVGLGFATAIPPGYVALLLPRSGTGAKHGVGVRNTVGIIDADYTGEWFAFITIDDVDSRGADSFEWEAGERLLQFVLVPFGTAQLTVVEELTKTQRGEGGFGSTGA